MDHGRFFLHVHGTPLMFRVFLQFPCSSTWQFFLVALETLNPDLDAGFSFAGIKSKILFVTLAGFTQTVSPFSELTTVP